MRSTCVPWNHARMIGPKPPLKPKHIWAIRTRLQHEGRTRDLAMFNVAIDSKLRGCDLVRLRVADVHLGDSIRLRTQPFSRRPAGRFPLSSPSPRVRHWPYGSHYADRAVTTTGSSRAVVAGEIT
jgi:hypothetical protein